MTGHHRTNARRRVGQVALAGFVLVGVFATQMGVAYAAGKVSPAPASSGVTEGQSYNVVFTLNAPIISPGGSSDPNVTLSFTPDDPSRVSFSPSTIQWTPSAWFQPRTLQVTAVADGIHDVSNTVVVQVTTTSGSVYYSGYTTSFTVVITDIDPAPTTTTTTSSPPTTTTPPTTGAPTSTSGFPTTTATDLTPTSTSNATSTSTTLIAVAPAHGTLPATGMPIGTALVGSATMLAAGLLLARSKRSRRDDR